MRPRRQAWSRRFRGAWMRGLLLGAVAWPAAALASSDDPPIELPPLIVTEETRPWRFVATDGIEVLSRCDDRVTQQFVLRYRRLVELTRLLLPDNLSFQTSAPATVVLVESVAAPQLAESLLAQFHGQADGAERRIRIMPNLGVTDVDALTVFAIVNPKTFAASRLGLAPDHLRMLVGKRTPPLPLWFSLGMLAVLRHAAFGETEVTLAPLTWRSQYETSLLRRDPDAPRELWCAADFFAFAGTRAFGEPEPDPAQAADRAAELARWVPQAELFVRWCLARPDRRAALWRLVEQPRGEMTETLLRAFFGCGYAEWRDLLSDFLPTAVDKPMKFVLTKPAPEPPLRIRDATAGEIGRLKVEWERLAWIQVRRQQPDFAPRYLEAARRTAAWARERGANDPEFAGIEGLLEVDAGNATGARPLLLDAARGSYVRPRVHIELARIQLAESVSVAGATGQISVADADKVLALLKPALAQRPRVAQAEALRLEVWTRAGLPIDDSRRLTAAEAVQHFPHDPAVLYFAAVLQARGGAFATARQLVEQALERPVSPLYEQRLTELRRMLAPAREHAPESAAAVPR